MIKIVTIYFPFMGNILMLNDYVAYLSLQTYIYNGKRSFLA